MIPPDQHQLFSVLRGQGISTSVSLAVVTYLSFRLSLGDEKTMGALEKVWPLISQPMLSWIERVRPGIDNWYAFYLDDLMLGDQGLGTPDRPPYHPFMHFINALVKPPES